MFFYYKPILFVVLLAGAFPKVTTYFKMTDVHCESFNKTIAEFSHCELRTLKDGAPAFDMNLMLKYPINDAQLNVEIYKKSTKYAPFIFNQTIDFCDFMLKSDNILMAKFHGLFKDFSNINHTCPYVGEQILSGFYVKQDTILPIPIPNGEYLLYMRWITGNVKIYETNVYFASTK